MAFQNILFPNPKLIHGLQKSVIQNVNVVTNGNTEYRILKNSQKRRKWVWPSRAMSQTDIDALITFLSGVNMMLDSFRFYDPFDKVEYHVRLDTNGLQWQAEILDGTNTVTYATISDISLIQVFE